MNNIVFKSLHLWTKIISDLMPNNYAYWSFGSLRLYEKKTTLFSRRFETTTTGSDFFRSVLDLTQNVKIINVA